jgi:hypothetical protein
MRSIEQAIVETVMGFVERFITPAQNSLYMSNMNNPYKNNVYKVRFSHTALREEDREFLFYQRAIVRDQAYLKTMQSPIH